jgi:glycosyltransferase involved in cell wall biosynthesis
MKKKKRIFFFIKSHFRERQWDTLKNIPEDFLPVYPPSEKLTGSVKVKTEMVGFLSRFKRMVVLSVPMLNVKKVPAMANECDFIYTWGYIPLMAKKPFVIEMDNPYCLTYYNLKAFKIYKKLIEGYLRTAYKLAFMSETSMHHFLHEFNGKFKERCVVIYPFAERRYEKSSGTPGKNVKFLFIGLDFRLKGGIELLEAFSTTKHQNIRLYIISFVPENIRKKFEKDRRILFIDPMPRRKLLVQVYPKVDVLVLPSLYESFGVVLLEALSFGLGLIATNVYAVPELLYNGENGVLLHHPFLKPESLWGKKAVNPVKYHISEFSKLYLKKEFFHYSLYIELKEAIMRAVDEHFRWKRKSIEVFEEKFSPEKWKYRFKEIFV